jgi:uncharacterized damage-inducible protein DinB
VSKLQLISDLYAYNEWANDVLLAKAEELDMGQLAGPQGASFESILGNMAHLAAAQINWLERWRTGQNKQHTVDLGESLKTLADLRETLAASHSDLQAYIRALSDAQVDSDLEYRDKSGNQAVRPLWQLMTHVANHGTYHRGEVAMALTALSHSPGDIDFLFWEFSRSN